MDHMFPVEGRHIHCQLSAICGEKAPVHSTVFKWVQSFKGKETTQAVVHERYCKTTQAVVHERYCKTPKEWFHEAILKLPRRWQQ
jgi:hypothetical protein